jgi:hypothetical protein
MKHPLTFLRFAKHFQFLLLFLVISLSSCKKKTTQPADNSYEVEYIIAPMNQHFVNITYTDANGQDVVITDPSLFVGGSRKIKVTAKPFTAKLNTIITNTSNDPVDFGLAIKVNGDFKTYQGVSAPPNSSNYTANLQFLVE